jgi:hypothetical protein
MSRVALRSPQLTENIDKEPRDLYNCQVADTIRCNLGARTITQSAVSDYESFCLVNT